MWVPAGVPNSAPQHCSNVVSTTAPHWPTAPLKYSPSCVGRVSTRCYHSVRCVCVCVCARCVCARARTAWQGVCSIQQGTRCRQWLGQAARKVGRVSRCDPDQRRSSAHVTHTPHTAVCRTFCYTVTVQLVFGTRRAKGTREAVLFLFLTVKSCERGCAHMYTRTHTHIEPRRMSNRANSIICSILAVSFTDLLRVVDLPSLALWTEGSLYAPRSLDGTHILASGIFAVTLQVRVATGNTAHRKRRPRCSASGAVPKIIAATHTPHPRRRPESTLPARPAPMPNPRLNPRLA